MDAFTIVQNSIDQILIEVTNLPGV